MITVVEIIVNAYNQTTVPMRFAYIIWILFIGLYLYASYHDKYHSLIKERDLKQRNWPYTLYVLGMCLIVIHHGSPMFQWGLEHQIIGADKEGILSVVGLMIMLSGLVVVAAARAALDGHWGPNIYKYKTSEDNVLIRKGIYQKIRHPVYTGQLLMTIGTVLIANNAWLIFFPIITYLVNIWRAVREDKDLMERFGDEFDNYKKQVSFMFGIG